MDASALLTWLLAGLICRWELSLVVRLGIAWENRPLKSRVSTNGASQESSFYKYQATETILCYRGQASLSFTFESSSTVALT
jgi:hypothetical protein